MHPVGRPAIILVKVMRVDSPAIGIAAGPSGGAESFVIRSKPLSFPIHVVLIGWLEIKTDDIAVLGNVDALLSTIFIGSTCQSCAAGRVRQREVIEQRLPALIISVEGNYVVRECDARDGIKNDGFYAARTNGLREIT